MSQRAEVYIKKLKDELNPDMSTKNEEMIRRLINPQNILQCQKSSTVRPECVFLMPAFSGVDIFYENSESLSFIKNLETVLLKKNSKVVPFTIQDVERLYQLRDFIPMKPQETPFSKALLNMSLCTDIIMIPIQYTGLSDNRKEMIMVQLIDRNEDFKQSMNKLSSSATDMALKKKMAALTTNIDKQIEKLKNY